MSRLANISILSAAAVMLTNPLWASSDYANPVVGAVRAANARFKDVAVALKEGYSPIPCASGTEGGSMGVHYVNAGLIKDDAIELSRPEAIMYSADGAKALLAVEYITKKGPADLHGHLFSFTSEPNRYGLPAFYELHVWAWKQNPKGAFADMNPDVSCDEMPVKRK
jgi:hypothetical protein